MNLQWVVERGFYILGTAIVLILFVVLGSHEVDGDLKAFALIAIIATFVLMMTLWYHRNSQATRKIRIEEIVSACSKDPTRAKLAVELYLHSREYASKANRNSLYSVLVLVALGVSVVFVGYVLNLDAVRFSTIGDLKNSEARALDIYQDSAQNSRPDEYWRAHPDEQKAFSDRQSTALATYKTASDRTTEALKRETEAQANMFSAGYRITSALITRASMIGVAIYLVILLNRGYKYNNGMASFYAARFMATLAIENDSETFVKRTKMFSPDIVYDTDIDHPLDKLKALFEKLLEKFGSSGGGNGSPAGAAPKVTKDRTSEPVKGETALPTETTLQNPERK